MKRIAVFFVVLLIITSVAFAESQTVLLDEDVEARLDEYIAEFLLTDECKSVIVNYLPDVNNFDRIEREALAAYRIIMNDETVYYLSVMKGNVPVCLQSAEEDYKSRIRYYDRFAK